MITPDAWCGQCRTRHFSPAQVLKRLLLLLLLPYCSISKIYDDYVDGWTDPGLPCHKAYYWR